MKRKIAFLLSIIIAVGGLVVPVHAQEQAEGVYGIDYVTYGDVNYDGAVAASDALVVLQNVVGKVTLDQHKTEVADVDNDNKISAADALMVLRFVVGKTTEFPAGVTYNIRTEEEPSADAIAAKAVEDSIEGIGTVTLEKEAEITAARLAYTALTDAQKALVGNLPVLEAAENALAGLKAQAEQEAKDKAAAKSVDDAIANIGTITLEKEAEITAAREAYAALTDAQKAHVTKLGVLETAEHTLATLKVQAEQEAIDKAAAKKVDDAIDNIGT
ncbi:MAG: hypothetical protein IKT68_05115, partial [Clostridia bacterium]|nr:hypothetical protein [Clostridia bacterium]